MPPLLPALAYLTGDLSLLRDDLRPDPLLLAMPQGGLTRGAARRRRASSRVEALIRYPRRRLPSPRRSRATTSCCRIMEYAVGGAEMAAYLPLLEEELAYRGEDRRAPAWHRTTRARRRLPRR